MPPSVARPVRFSSARRSAVAPLEGHAAHAAVGVAGHVDGTLAELDACARLGGVVGCRLPQLAGAVLGVGEALDQRGLGVGGVLTAHELVGHVGQHGRHREALHALSAPVGRDLRGVAAPELLGVPLEEHRVQAVAKAVDVEVLEVVLGQRTRLGGQVARAHARGGGHAHRAQRACVERDGVVEEPPVVVDARHALAREHHALAGLRVGAAVRQDAVAAKQQVVEGGGSLHGHDVLPPVAHAPLFREEPVAAHVHAVAVVRGGARDAAHRVGGLHHPHADLAARAPRELVGCGYARGSRAYDQDVQWHASSSFSVFGGVARGGTFGCNRPILARAPDALRRARRTCPGTG